LLSLIISPPVCFSKSAGRDVVEHRGQYFHVQEYVDPFVNLDMAVDAGRGHGMMGIAVMTAVSES
jgi:hypothetical protein